MGAPKSKSKSKDTKKKKKKHPKKEKKNNSKEDEVIQDERFQRASTHPQFSSNKKSSSGSLLTGGQKVEIDERFAPLLTDERFKIPGSGGGDKYGCKKKKRGKEGEGLDAFYTLKKTSDVEKVDDEGEKDDDDDDSFSSSSSSESFNEEGEKAKKKADSEDDAEEEDDIPFNDDPASRIAYLTALSRGEISGSSDTDSSSSDESSTSSSSSEDESDVDSIYKEPSIFESTPTQEEELLTTEESPYLAVCNMDWEHVCAVDILVILSSFGSIPGGSVRSVTIYPSDFGMERMKRDEVLGPRGLWKKDKKKKKEDDENESEEEGGGSDDEYDSSSSDVENENEDSENKQDSDEDEEEDEDDVLALYSHFQQNSSNNAENNETDFDPEKLRAYEASKLRYYFAVVTCTTPAAADVIYKEVDGLELGHSSSTLDLQVIPPSNLQTTIQNRKIKDEATSIPSNYNPPDFVVSALQQTNVQCTWEDGDAERERKLTKYGMGDEAWEAMVEGDDLRAYLASDGSSSEDSSEDEGGGEEKKGGKGNKMRKLLGLDSDDNDDEDGMMQKTNASSDGSSSSEEEEGVMEATFIPGKGTLKDKIKSKLESKRAGKEETEKELTPWEKYQLKRKEKRRERRKAARNRRKGIVDENDGKEEDEDDGMYGADPEFGVPESDDDDDDDEEQEHKFSAGGGGDDFFAEEANAVSAEKKGKKNKKKSCDDEDNKEEEEGRGRPSTKEELELLIAGDHDEEAAKDYDIRGLVRMEKNATKKLRGSRKRKEAARAANVSGTTFKIDTKDERFAALLEGDDDRFGIDRTDPNYKETPAMKEVLAEQTKRRKRKRARAAQSSSSPTNDVRNKSKKGNSGGETNALANKDDSLSSLVKSIKTKVGKKKK